MVQKLKVISLFFNLIFISIRAFFLLASIGASIQLRKLLFKLRFRLVLWRERIPKEARKDLYFRYSAYLNEAFSLKSFFNLVDMPSVLSYVVFDRHA
jgi:hypothetical protein